MLGVAACALIAAPSASAAELMGDPCAATGTSTAAAAIVLNNNMSGAALPVDAVPETPWVITKWKVNAAAGIGAVPQQLIVTHGVGEEADQLVGESSLETVVGGAANEFLTRIPIPEYGHIGLRGPDGALVCEEHAHLAGLVAEPWSLGESRHFRIETSLGVPVVATLEPDRDHDGYGDETQDGCPSQPLVHTACPFIRLVPTAKVFRSGVLVEVSTGDPAKVEVSGQVAWGYRPKRGAPPKRLIVGLSGGVQEVGLNATVPFWLPLPRPVVRRLGKLSSKQKLNAHLAIVATDITGHQTTRALGVRLPGYLKGPVGRGYVPEAQRRPYPPDRGADGHDDGVIPGSGPRFNAREVTTTRKSRSQSAASPAATLRW
jgi:hypothetical protein